MTLYVEIDYGTGTERYYSIVGEQAEYAVLSVSPFQRAVAWEGNIQTPLVQVVFDDTNRKFRNFVSGANEFVGLKARVVSAFGTFEGFISRWAPLRDKRFAIFIQDELSWYLARSVPPGVITQTDYPNAPAESIDRPLLYPYGILDSTLFGNPVGAVETFCVDTVNNDYFVSALPIEAVTAVYREENGQWVSVSSANWSVITSGLGHTLIRVTPQTGGPGSGKEKIRFDCKGIKSGASALTNPVDVIEHFLVNVVGIPQTSIDTTSRDSTKTAVSSKNFKMAGVLVEARPASQVLVEMMRSSMVEVFMTSGGKIGFRLYEPTPAADITIANESELLSWDLSIDFDDLSNRIVADYAPIWGTSEHYGNVSKEDQQSISVYGTLQQTFDLPWTYDSFTATEIARTLLNRRKTPPIRATMKLNFRNDLDLGIRVKLIHTDQLSESSLYTVEEMRIDPWSGETELRCVDLRALTPLRLAIYADDSFIGKDYTTATEAERVYGWYADAITGKMPNGDEPYVYA